MFSPPARSLKKSNDLVFSSGDNDSLSSPSSSCNNSNNPPDCPIQGGDGDACDDINEVKNLYDNSICEDISISPGSCHDGTSIIDYNVPCSDSNSPTDIGSIRNDFSDNENNINNSYHDGSILVPNTQDSNLSTFNNNHSNMRKDCEQRIIEFLRKINVSGDFANFKNHFISFNSFYQNTSFINFLSDFIISYFNLSNLSKDPNNVYVFNNIKPFDYNHVSKSVPAGVDLSNKQRKKQQYSDFQFMFKKNRRRACSNLLDGVNSAEYISPNSVADFSNIEG